MEQIVRTLFRRLSDESMRPQQSLPELDYFAVIHILLCVLPFRSTGSKTDGEPSLRPGELCNCAFQFGTPPASGVLRHEINENLQSCILISTERRLTLSLTCIFLRNTKSIFSRLPWLTFKGISEKTFRQKFSRKNKIKRNLTIIDI